MSDKVCTLENLVTYPSWAELVYGAIVKTPVAGFKALQQKPELSTGLACGENQHLYIWRHHDLKRGKENIFLSGFVCLSHCSPFDFSVAHSVTSTDRILVVPRLQQTVDLFR